MTVYIWNKKRAEVTSNDSRTMKSQFVNDALVCTYVRNAQPFITLYKLFSFDLVKRTKWNYWTRKLEWKIWCGIFGYKSSNEMRFIRHVPSSQTHHYCYLFVFLSVNVSSVFVVVVFPFACCFELFLAIYNKAVNYEKSKRWKSINHPIYIGAKYHKKWFVLNSFDPIFFFRKKHSTRVKLSISAVSGTWHTVATAAAAAFAIFCLAFNCSTFATWSLKINCCLISQFEWLLFCLY